MRRLVAPLAALSMLVAAAPAGAQEDGGEVVARSGDVTLNVRDERGAPCLVLVGDGAVGSAETCSGDGGGLLLVGKVAGQELVGAAVPAEALVVEVRRAGKLLATGPTVVGEAYKGKGAAQLRFALVPLPPGARTDGLRVRALDASGAPVAVVAADDGRSALVTHTRVIQRGRSGRVRWIVRTKRSSELGSSVANLDREVVSRCVETEARSAQEGGSSEQCTSEDPMENLLGELAAGPVPVRALEVCGERFRLVSGGVAGRIARVSVLLGDGRTVAARAVRRAEVLRHERLFAASQ